MKKRGAGKLGGEKRRDWKNKGAGNFFAMGDFLGPVGVDMGMIRGFLFLAAGVFAAGGLLTVLRSPDWLNWKLALVAGEFGHGLALSINRRLATRCTFFRDVSNESLLHLDPLLAYVPNPGREAKALESV